MTVVYESRNYLWVSFEITEFYLVIKPKAIFGQKDTLLEIFGKHTAYIERTHLTMRTHNARLARKSITFSKKLAFHKAAIIWDDVTYNFCKALKSLRIDVNPDAKRFESRYKHQSPAMATNLTNHLWSYEELLRYVPIPTNS